ncbi:hypothetical protein OHV05_37800 (plasmid) [Kitasatospora sp. NBC_00070]|uniref:ParB/RepB/Spo0J family partition protein n=1 Tax=Kitasatospora sp. NBC_00070 TaxID=2975962 RepID=UPI0032508597
MVVVQAIPLDLISPTPLNSRRDFGPARELLEFGLSLVRTQLQPIVVVPRADYLKLWPEHDDGSLKDFVLAAGERRWRGLVAADAATIGAVVRPEIAETQLAFLDAVFTENFARKNLDAIEEACAIEELVKVLGTARAVAEHYGKTEGWASQRRSLLKLTPDLQRLVSSKAMPLDAARSIALLPAPQQEAAWFELTNRPKPPRQQRSRANPAKVTPQVAAGLAASAPARATQLDTGTSRSVSTARGPSHSPVEALTEDFTAVKSRGEFPNRGGEAGTVPAPAEGVDPAGVRVEEPPLAGIWSALVAVPPTDIPALARVIRNVLDPRELYALAAELVESLRGDPEPADAT